METLGYFEAWGRWLEGQQVNEHLMWGLTLLWWARIGKLLQFMAGLTVVLDLIGPERLVAAAHRLGAYGWDEVKRRTREQVAMSAVIKEMSAATRTYRTATTDREQRAAAKKFERLLNEGPGYARAVRLTRWANALRWGLFAGGGYVLYDDAVPVLAKYGVGVLLLAFTLAMLRVPVLLVQIIGMVWVVLRSAYALLIMSAARPILLAIGDKDRPGYVLRWVAFLAFLVGFQFDLLGS